MQFLKTLQVTLAQHGIQQRGAECAGHRGAGGTRSGAGVEPFAQEVKR